MSKRLHARNNGIGSERKSGQLGERGGVLLRLRIAHDGRN